jgi:UDP-N-acetylglucosamine--N-acetylmuramyl-(pentapeptide) pyrophosphoryl-undecaprenol N-acetylglucosamine transferase
VAEELIHRGHEVKLYLSNKAIDQQVAQQNPGYDFVFSPAIGWQGLNYKVFKFAWSLWSAYRLCVKEMDAYRPQVVVGMGGFTSAAPLIVAMKRRTPALLHESNVFPGRVTRWFAHKVDKLLFGFKECSDHLKVEKFSVTGTPVRSALKKMDASVSRSKLDLDRNLKTLLIMGGSQGARSMNKFLLNAVPLLGDDWKSWQVLHITGPYDAKLVYQTYERHGVQAVVMPFCNKMEYAYSAADLVVSRAGAASLSEIAYYGLPSLLIPYPHAADDHQMYNAEVFVKKGAARRLNEKKATIRDLARELHALLRDDPYRIRAAEAAKQLYEGEPVKKIAGEIENAIR